MELEGNEELLPGWQEATGRDVAALLDPRPTLIVASAGTRKNRGFATILWATPISHDPAMLVIALRDRSHTMGCIKDSGCFSLNVMPATQQALDLAQLCGTRSGRSVNKVPLVKHHMTTVSYEVTKTHEVMVKKAGLFRKARYEQVTETQECVREVPLVDLASSWLICAVDHIEETGDHLLVVAKVVSAQTTAKRNDQGQLEPFDVLQCVQHGCFGKVVPLDQEVAAPAKKTPAPAPPAPSNPLHQR